MVQVRKSVLRAGNFSRVGLVEILFTSLPPAQCTLYGASVDVRLHRLVATVTQCRVELGANQLNNKQQNGSHYVKLCKTFRKTSLGTVPNALDPISFKLFK